MRTKSSPILRIATFFLATLSATGALVAAGLNEASSAVDGSIGCSVSCVASPAK